MVDIESAYNQYAQTRDSCKFNIKVTGSDDENLFAKIYDINTWQQTVDATDDTVYRHMIRAGLQEPARSNWTSHMRFNRVEGTKQNLYAFLFEDFDYPKFVKRTFQKLRNMKQNGMRLEKYYRAYKLTAAEYECVYLDVKRYKPNGLGTMERPTAKQKYQWFFNSLDQNYKLELHRIVQRNNVDMHLAVHPRARPHLQHARAHH